MEDPEIDRRGGGGGVCKNLYKPQLVPLLNALNKNIAIQGFKRRILEHISAEIWAFFCFGNTERGRAGSPPLSGSAIDNECFLSCI